MEFADDPNTEGRNLRSVRITQVLHLQYPSLMNQESDFW